MIYFQLFFEFLKVGLFTVGGGLASLPFLEDIAENTGWFTTKQLADMIAISESTPGPIGINMATYVGFTTAGIGGAIIASLGFIVPALVIAGTVSRFLKKFNENKFVKGIKCVEMELGEPDESGRRSPIEKENSEYTLDVNTVI